MWESQCQQNVSATSYVYAAGPHDMQSRASNLNIACTCGSHATKGVGQTRPYRLAQIEGETSSGTGKEGVITWHRQKWQYRLAQIEGKTSPGTVKEGECLLTQAKVAVSTGTDRGGNITWHRQRGGMPLDTGRGGSIDWHRGGNITWHRQRGGMSLDTGRGGSIDWHR